MDTEYTIDMVLADAFEGADWESVKNDGDAVGLLCADYRDAAESEGCTPDEYRRRIGRGNLRSYADVLIAGRNRRA